MFLLRIDSSTITIIERLKRIIEYSFNGKMDHAEITQSRVSATTCRQGEICSNLLRKIYRGRN